MKTSREIPGDRTNLMKAGFSTDVVLHSFYNFFFIISEESLFEADG